MKKSSSILKNLFMVLSSNVLLLSLGIAMSLLLPIILSVDEYGYWQIYLYYSGFVGMFMLGFNDGMNLRYAGKSYNELDKELFQY
ncbi:MAG: hypothetical protein Q4G63_13150, partial [Bacteroidia bacterium]|nr:hypothetical protein [Bacteroidia bacterium]